MHRVLSISSFVIFICVIIWLAFLFSSKAKVAQEYVDYVDECHRYVADGYKLTMKIEDGQNFVLDNEEREIIITPLVGSNPLEEVMNIYGVFLIIFCFFGPLILIYLSVASWLDIGC